MTPTEHWTTIVLIAIGIAATVPTGRRILGHRFHPADGVAAAAALTSLVMAPGLIAAVLATPWLALAVVATIRSLPTGHRFTAERRIDLDRVLEVLALGWWANASLWLVAHRAGIEPLGFDRTITLLTVGHFHHAGFGLTVLLLAARRRLRASRLVDTTCIGHQLGMILVAIGISFDDRLEVAGAVTITAALGGWAWLAVGRLRHTIDGRIGRMLVVLSAVAWVLPMGLAVGWAASPFLPAPAVTTFDTMLRYHAAVNAIGLVLAGLVALVLADRHPAGHIGTPDPVDHPGFRGRPDREFDQRLDHRFDHRLDHQLDHREEQPC